MVVVFSNLDTYIEVTDQAKTPLDGIYVFLIPDLTLPGVPGELWITSTASNKKGVAAKYFHGQYLAFCQKRKKEIQVERNRLSSYQNEGSEELPPTLMLLSLDGDGPSLPPAEQIVTTINSEEGSTVCIGVKSSANCSSKQAPADAGNLHLCPKTLNRNGTYKHKRTEAFTEQQLRCFNMDFGNQGAKVIGYGQQILQTMSNYLPEMQEIFHHTGVPGIVKKGYEITNTDSQALQMGEEDFITRLKDQMRLAIAGFHSEDVINDAVELARNNKKHFFRGSVGYIPEENFSTLPQDLDGKKRNTLSRKEKRTTVIAGAFEAMKLVTAGDSHQEDNIRFSEALVTYASRDQEHKTHMLKKKENRKLFVSHGLRCRGEDGQGCKVTPKEMKTMWKCIK
jgi:hypothetical protein